MVWQLFGLCKPYLLHSIGFVWWAAQETMGTFSCANDVGEYHHMTKIWTPLHMKVCANFPQKIKVNAWYNCMGWLKIEGGSLIASIF
jgi:hypothetical protein